MSSLDIWGWNGGRTRAIADLLASDGAVVIVPKLLDPFEGGNDGDGLPPNFDMGARGAEMRRWLATMHFHGKIERKCDGLLQYIRENYHGHPVSAVGFCWGGYVVCHLAAKAPELVSAVIPHPSIHLEQGLYGGSNAALASQVFYEMLCSY